MEDRRVDRIRDDDRLAQLEAELAMLRERELRLEDRRGRERGVDLGDPRVGAVVEPPVRADRPIDPMHHPRTPASEAPQATEVEVERVEEAHGRAAGDRPGSTTSPRRSNSPTSARRNWCPPPRATARTRGRARGRCGRGESGAGRARFAPSGSSRARDPPPCEAALSRRSVRPALPDLEPGIPLGDLDVALVEERLRAADEPAHRSSSCARSSKNPSVMRTSSGLSRRAQSSVSENWLSRLTG